MHVRNAVRSPCILAPIATRLRQTRTVPGALVNLGLTRDFSALHPVHQCSETVDYRQDDKYGQTWRWRGFRQPISIQRLEVSGLIRNELQRGSSQCRGFGTD